MDPSMRVSSLALVGTDPVVCGPTVLLAAQPALANEPAWDTPRHTPSDTSPVSTKKSTMQRNATFKAKR